MEVSMSFLGRTIGFLVLLFLISLCPTPVAAMPLGRSFTYQGQLNQAGNPVEGNVSLRFSLWDAAGTGDPPTGGAQIGASQVIMNVPINKGVFSVAVNNGNEFGSTAFDGQSRWLQVEVCSDSSCTSATILGPRQPITGAPYALGPWQLNGTSITYTGGFVGIGTATPAMRLDVRGGPIAVENLGDQADLLWLNTERNWVFRQEGAGAGAALKLQNIGGGGNKNFIVQTTGLMGVGTTTPTAKLDVRGDIRLGPSGEFLATTGSENLRVLRARVSDTGVVLSGSGISVGSHTQTGVYLLNFSPGFPTLSPAPTVIVTPTSSSVPSFAIVSGESWSGVFVRIMNTSGTLINETFNVIVVGAR
jgi:hypothetical protein